MFSNDEFAPVLDAVELLIAERKELRSGGLHFLIVHLFTRPGSDCMAGEEIFAIFLVYRGRAYQLK